MLEFNLRFPTMSAYKQVSRVCTNKCSKVQGTQRANIRTCEANARTDKTVRVACMSVFIMIICLAPFFNEMTCENIHSLSVSLFELSSEQGQSYLKIFSFLLAYIYRMGKDAMNF